MTLPFLPALAWALAFAVVFTPIQRWLELQLKYPSVAAMCAVMLIGLIVVIPVMLVGQQLILEAAKGAELIRSNIESGEWRRTIEAQPRLESIVIKVEQLIDVPGIVETLTRQLTLWGGIFVRGSAVQLMNFCLIFYILYFFLRDRESVLQSFRSVLPLTSVETNRLFRRIDDTIHATIYGTLAVASLQGLLGGLMFWWLGISLPLLWGVVMAVLSIVPVLGAFVVWIPVVLLLAIEGKWGSALILALWGVLVVGTMDNLLRPFLVGNRLKVHTVPVFISVVGGLIVFGTAGLILGPVTLTMTMARSKSGKLKIDRSQTISVNE
jgi:predicted PurR-regulated permease PerM